MIIKDSLEEFKVKKILNDIHFLLINNVKDINSLNDFEKILFNSAVIWFSEFESKLKLLNLEEKFNLSILDKFLLYQLILLTFKESTKLKEKDILNSKSFNELLNIFEINEQYKNK